MHTTHPGARWRSVVIAAALSGALAGGLGACTTTDNNDRSAGTVIDDAVITSQVKSAFLADPTVKGLTIDVDTSDGVVTLSGKVNSQTEIDRAVSLAENRDGVRSVRNNLRMASAGQ